MKRLMKWIIPVILIVLIIGSAFWYMLVYDRSTVQDFLNAQARNSARDGHFKTATWFYDMSYRLSDQDKDVAIELANIYKSAGNYTKAEVTLTNAIADGATAELYIALSQTFVEQDKLLDAVTMLENITDPAIKAELDAMRPAAPTVDKAPGFYSEYITLNFQSSGGTLYITTNGQYPTTANAPSTGSVTLEGGETKIYALCVAENGLVSPISIFNYTVGGVIEDVTLADPALDALVRSQLLLDADAVISTEDIWTITELTVPAETTTLEDLKYFISLEKLTIDGMDIPDLGVIAGMTNLKELNITDCSLGGSMSMFGNLQRLERLTLSGSGVSSLSDIAEAENVIYLDLSDNAIGDITPLSGMYKLEQLNLSDNAVADPSALTALKELEELNLANNSLPSLPDLSACTQLSTLDVSGNSLVALDGVKGLSALVSLSASNNALVDVDALSGLDTLSKLDVSHNAIPNLSGIAGLSSITELNFAYNEVTALPDFGDGSELMRIVGDYNKLTDISSLNGLPNLNYVYLDHNADLSDISGLKNCHRLAQLNVYGTKVTTESVTPLVDMDVIVNYDPT